jgi:hypothetical protein
MPPSKGFPRPMLALRRAVPVTETLELERRICWVPAHFIYGILRRSTFVLCLPRAVCMHRCRCRDRRLSKCGHCLFISPAENRLPLDEVVEEARRSPGRNFNKFDELVGRAERPLGDQSVYLLQRIDFGSVADGEPHLCLPVLHFEPVSRGPPQPAVGQRSGHEDVVELVELRYDAGPAVSAVDEMRLRKMLKAVERQPQGSVSARASKYSWPDEGRDFSGGLQHPQNRCGAAKEVEPAVVGGNSLMGAGAGTEEVA